MVVTDRASALRGEHGAGFADREGTAEVLFGAGLLGAAIGRVSDSISVDVARSDDAGHGQDERNDDRSEYCVHE